MILGEQFKYGSRGIAEKFFDCWLAVPEEILDGFGACVSDAQPNNFGWSAAKYRQIDDVAVSRDDDEAVNPGVVPNIGIRRSLEVEKAHLRTLGIDIGKPSHEFVGNVLIEEQLQPRDTKVFRSRSAA